MRKLLIFSILIGFFTACQVNDTPQYSANSNPLFDLKNFFDNEIKTHLKDVKKVKKTVTVNGKSETKEVDIKDWHEELKPFFNSDINRPAWRDKYFVEKQEVEPSTYKTEFKAKDKNLKTQFMSVFQKPSDFDLYVKNYEESSISKAESSLSYKRDSQNSINYEINTNQNLITGQDSIKINVTLIGN